MLIPELISYEEAAARAAAFKHPHVTRAMVLEKIEDFYFTSYGPTTICVLSMWNEFRVVGESHVVHPLNIDAELGQYWAFQNAVDKATPFVAYELACQLAGTPLTSAEQAEVERKGTPRPYTADVNFSAIYGVKELPAWKSHKIVWAAKVFAVGKSKDAFVWNLEGGGVVEVSNALAQRGGIEPGAGYFVRYEDGYESWSPAAAFEDGYTKLG